MSKYDLGIHTEHVSKIVTIGLRDNIFDDLISDCSVYGSSLMDSSDTFHIVKDEFTGMDNDDIEHFSTAKLVDYVKEKYGKDEEIGDLVFCK